MARSSNQKMKLLYLIKILSEKTDEGHRLTARELSKELEAYGIRAERKSIYDDIDCLIHFGYDIVNVKAKTGGGYYLAGRDFELPELKLLVDAVQASRFLTLKKSRELIAKIEKLAGPFDAGKLHRQVFVAGRVKTENESIYYNVDSIHRAIQADCRIRFIYMEWNIKKELRPRRGGIPYEVSPLALTFKEENYYLIAFDEADEKIKHFRVDKMGRIAGIEGGKRSHTQEFDETAVGEYVTHSFGMFGGKMQTVTLLLPDSLVGALIDRFGRECEIRRRQEGVVSVRVAVSVSSRFFGWLSGFGGSVELLSPEKTREEYAGYLEKILERYRPAD